MNAPSTKAWELARNEARALLIERAGQGNFITYSELANRIQSMQLEAHDPRLARLLGEISTEEDKAGRGMLSVIVVHKHGDCKPGRGFFDLARELGRDASDEDKLFSEELKHVFATWKSGSRA